MRSHLAKANIVITTAQVPGKKAPVILSKEELDAMDYAIIIDLAAEQGGNCDLSSDQKPVLYKKIKIIGNSNLPSQLPKQASLLYGRNIMNLLGLILKEGKVVLDKEDDILAAALLK